MGSTCMFIDDFLLPIDRLLNLRFPRLLLHALLLIPGLISTYRLSATVDSYEPSEGSGRGVILFNIRGDLT